MRALVVLLLKLLGTSVCFLTFWVGLMVSAEHGAGWRNQSHELRYWLAQAIALGIMGVSVFGIVFIWKRRKPATDSSRSTSKQ